MESDFRPPFTPAFREDGKIIRLEDRMIDPEHEILRDSCCYEIVDFV